MRPMLTLRAVPATTMLRGYSGKLMTKILK
jgi:hypothetical protein